VSPQITLGLVSNLFSRMMHFKSKGDVEVGHTHPFDHLTLLAHGSLNVEVNGKTTEFKAPHMIFIKAEYVHKLTALEDNTVAYCIHAIRKDRHGDIVDPSMMPKGVTANDVAASPLIVNWEQTAVEDAA